MELVRGRRRGILESERVDAHGDPDGARPKMGDLPAGALWVAPGRSGVHLRREKARVPLGSVLCREGRIVIFEAGRRESTLLVKSLRYSIRFKAAVKHVLAVSVVVEACAFSEALPYTQYNVPEACVHIIVYVA